MKNILIILIFLLVSGCATIFDGSSQDLMVTTTNDKDDNNTKCEVTNEEGTWYLSPKAPSLIYRDGNTMYISCKNSSQEGQATIEPKFNGIYLGANILIDLCIISCWVDGGTNSWYEYPIIAPVQMRDKGTN